MQEQDILDIGFETIIVTMKLASPALLSALFTGIIISIIQAATQINEQTLSFIPKILAMILAIFITGPWLLKIIVNFAKEIFTNIPDYIKN